MHPTPSLLYSIHLSSSSAKREKKRESQTLSFSFSLSSFLPTLPLPPLLDPSLYTSPGTRFPFCLAPAPPRPLSTTISDFGLPLGASPDDSSVRRFSRVLGIWGRNPSSRCHSARCFRARWIWNPKSRGLESGLLSWSSGSGALIWSSGLRGFSEWSCSAGPGVLYGSSSHFASFGQRDCAVGFFFVIASLRRCIWRGYLCDAGATGWLPIFWLPGGAVISW